MVNEPDGTIVHEIDECDNCKKNIKQMAFLYERRQVFDLVDNNRFITEHQIQVKVCDSCGCTSKAPFPEDVRAPVQYGKNVKATAVYLNKRQLLPYLRTAETISDLLGIKLSAGTIVTMIKEASELLEDTEKVIKRGIMNSPVVHFDESGMQVDGHRHWVHVAVTNVASYFMPHYSRGPDAMAEMGILPSYSGYSIHDHWKSYFTFTDSDHFLCNAHHLRELEFIHERYKHSWAKEMQDLLREIKKYVDAAKNKGYSSISRKKHNFFSDTFSRIIDKGYLEDPPIPEDINSPKKPGPKAQSKGRNLLDRFSKFKDSVLGFMTDYTIPFDNNQAERDVRMLKVQQKISGTFRSEQGSIDYCRIVSYISTVRKNSINAIRALSSIFTGSPILPRFLLERSVEM